MEGQASLSPETWRAIRRIDLSVKRFALMLLTVGLLVSGANLHIADKNPPFGIPLMILPVVAFLWGMGKRLFVLQVRIKLFYARRADAMAEFRLGALLHIGFNLMPDTVFVTDILA